jgi:HSP20 family protein
MRSARLAMDRLFEQFFGENTPEGSGAASPTYYLPVDVFESDQAYTLVASVPGFKQEQVEITLEDGILSIRATAGDHKAPGRWLRQERPYGSFVRRLEVPQQVETGKIDAELDNGVLTVTIPKTAKPHPVKIQIGSGSQAMAPSPPSNRIEGASRQQGRAFLFQQRCRFQ